MARQYQVAGEGLVQVKNAAIALAQLGLTDSSITIHFNFHHFDIHVDAWGGVQGPPPEIQLMLADVTISMSLVHFDAAVLNSCISESMGGAATVGTVQRAGSRMGNDVALQAANNRFIQLGISAPISGAPWRFFAAYLTNNPLIFPVGAERSVAVCNWRAIPYPPGGDPYNSGSGAGGVAIWDRSAIS